MFEEHVRLITSCPLAAVSSLVLAQILTTAYQIIFTDSIFGLLMSKLLNGITAEDVNRCIMATLGIDDDAILFLGFPQQIHVDDGHGRETTVVHHVACCIVGIAQTLHLDLLFIITSHQQIFVNFRTRLVDKVVGTGGQ